MSDAAGNHLKDWTVIETDEGHEIRMATATDQTRVGHEVQHVIKYEHGLFPDEGGKHGQRQYREAQEIIALAAAAPDLRAAKAAYEHGVAVGWARSKRGLQ